MGNNCHSSKKPKSTTFLKETNQKIPLKVETLPLIENKNFNNNFQPNDILSNRNKPLKLDQPKFQCSVTEVQAKEHHFSEKIKVPTMNINIKKFILEIQKKFANENNHYENYLVYYPTQYPQNTQIKKTPLIYISENLLNKIPKKLKKDIKTIDLERFEFISSIDEKVFKARKIKTNSIHSIKFFKNIDYHYMRLEDIIMSKIEEINSTFRLIKYFGLFKELNHPDSEFLLIKEYGDANLKEMIHIRGKYELENALYIFESLLEDLIYLKNNGIAVRDLKTETILLIPSNLNSLYYNYKISDFKIACFLNNDEKEINRNQLTGYTSNYSAPEIQLIIDDKWNEKNYDPFKADVYSLAIILIELLGYSKDTYLFNSQHILYDIILKMLSDNPLKRISFEETLELINNLINEHKINCFPPKKENDFVQKFSEWKKNNTKEEKIKNYIKDYKNFMDISFFNIAEENLNQFYNIYLNSIEDFKNTLVEIEIMELFAEFYSKYKKDKEKSEKYFTKVLEVKEKIFGLESINLCETYNKIAEFYENNEQDYKEAENFYFKSLKIREQISGKLNSETAILYDSLASFYANYGEENYLNSEQYYMKSLNIRESIFGKENTLTAQSYQNLAIFYENIYKDYNKADEYYIKAIKIREKQEYDPETASLYNSVAMFYESVVQDFSKAEEYYLKSMKIREKIYGEFHSETASIYNNIAMFYHNITQDFKEAEFYYLKSMKIFEEVLGENHSNTSSIYNSIAAFYEDVKQDYNLAEKFYLKSMKIREKINGFDHPNTATIYNNIAAFYVSVKHEYSKAEKYFLKAMRIYENIYGDKHPDTALSYYNYGMFIKDHGDDRPEEIQNAKKYCLKAAIIYEKCYGPKHIKTLNAKEAFNY